MADRVSAGTDPQPLTAVYSERTTCRACSAGSLRPVLNLGNQYLPRFFKDRTEELPVAPLELNRCESCGLLQLKHTVNPDLLFREFWYRSGVNHSMQRALNDVVIDGLRWHNEGVWLDIGANDGYLLSRVPVQFTKVAIEPAENFRAELAEHTDIVVTGYFPGPDALVGCPQAQVITSIAMFYDVDRPGEFLEGIRLALAPDGVWINQLNDSPTMMKANAFDAICHEHLCYYDIPTLRLLYARHGLKIVGISHNDVNGGSVRIIAAHADSGYEETDLLGLKGVSYHEAEAFASRTRRWKDVFGELIHNLGPGIWCYGASTKGAVLLQYLNLPNSFEAIADRNPLKHGLRMAGTWLPIVGEDEFRKARPRYAVALPWAFRDEFIQREQAARAAGTTLIFPLPTVEFVV